MDPASAAKTKPALKFESAADVLASPIRWRMLAELAKGQPLPVVEMARRLHLPATNISKHAAVLRDCGVIQRGFGSDYRIAEKYLVPGERAIDLGVALLRLDHVA